MADINVTNIPIQQIEDALSQLRDELNKYDRSPTRRRDLIELIRELEDDIERARS